MRKSDKIGRTKNLEVIKILSSKYGMDFKDFEKKLGKSLKLDWEHEKDYIEWDWAIGNIKSQLVS